MSNNAFNFDESWKLLVKVLTQQLLEYMYPELAAHIDFNIAINFEVQELIDKLLPSNEFAYKLDNLLLVTLKNTQKPAMVLIHVEVEANEPSNLMARMFNYYITIMKIYPDAEIYPLVIYIGFKPFKLKWFQIKNFGLSLHFTCCYYDINEHKEEEYIGNENPFTIFLLLSMWINEYRKKQLLSKKEIVQKLKTELDRRQMTEKYFEFLHKFVIKLLTLPKEDAIEIKNIFTKNKNIMYENIKTNFQANEILESQVRMWHEGKSLETFIYESQLLGLQKGEQLGLQRGEFQKACAIAKSLKNQGVAYGIIVQATGLPLEEITNL